MAECMKPSDAALKAARETYERMDVPHNESDDLWLAARIDAAADEKYAEQLEALAKKWDESATWRHESSVSAREQGECSDEEYAMAGGEMTVWNDCAKELRDALRKIKGEK